VGWRLDGRQNLAVVILLLKSDLFIGGVAMLVIIFWIFAAPVVLALVGMLWLRLISRLGKAIFGK
jgi:CHASE2 domain-containing sensor protein